MKQIIAMTITQLQYALAVAQHNSFSKAAEYCHISQSTLSMQIKKLEQSLNVLIFDRTKKPVELTPIGAQIMEQAKIGLSELDRIKDIVGAKQNEFPSSIKIGIIPTLSPYLLPLFLVPFIKKYPKVKVSISELQTLEIIDCLRSNDIDFGILVTPLEDNTLTTQPLFYEPFLAYISEKHPLSRKAWVQSEDLKSEDFWLLESGHCFREQTLKICQKTNFKASSSLHFESGSLETLRNLVDGHYGYTLLPQLATMKFDATQKNRIRPFRTPIPVREVSLVCHQNYYKTNLRDILFKEIRTHIPDDLLEPKHATKLITLDS
ncbi:MAG: hydrogen peroxide-inducible genes activator [Bacteroidota bacterium]